MDLAKSENYRVTLGTLRGHKKHIVVKGAEDEKKGPPPTNIEILQEIIAKGFDNRKNWRPTISDTMKAMDMWFKLTQGNPFDELLDALADAALGEENPEAQKEKSEAFDEEEVGTDGGGDGRGGSGFGEAILAAYQPGPSDIVRENVEVAE